MTLPDLDSLRCFEAAAVHLNFRIASRKIGLSPGAFSDRIRLLEDHLGQRLFERTTRRIALTDAGRKLLPQARRTLEEARRCLDVVRSDGRRAPFEVIVGTRHELGISWLLPSLDPLREARPERTVSLFFGNSNDLLGNLEKGTIDAMVSSLRLTRPGLAYAKLHEERYVFVASKALMAARPLRDADDARGHVLVDTERDLPLFRYFLDALETPEVWTFQAVERIGTIEGVRQRVRAGLAVAVLPSYFVAEDLAKKRLVRILPAIDPRVDAFRLVWRAGDPREEEFQALASDLRDRPLQ
jgi:LysR family transcriptional regulator, glycine cleavage system transcriptional activator